MKSVRPVESTRLNAPGDMEENIVSKMSKLLSSGPLLEMELSRHVLKSGSFMSNTFAFDVGVKVERGAVDVEDMLVLNPFERLFVA